jgi:hypothetical protein
MTAADVEQARSLQVLLDKQEIHEVLLRQARAFDRRDKALFETIYHAGAQRLTPDGYLPQPDAQLATNRSYDAERPPSSRRSPTCAADGILTASSVATASGGSPSGSSPTTGVR